MRTTLNIEDDLYRQVKATAALRGCSVTSLIEESLRLAMAAEAEPLRPMPISTRRPGFTADFLGRAIDMNDTGAVLDALDEREGR